MDASSNCNLSKILSLQKETGETKYSGRKLLDVYYHALTNSTRWDQGLGYFRLSALKLLAYPLAKFILFNDGRLRVYCNEQVSEKDYKILSEKRKYVIHDSTIFDDIVDLHKALKGANNDLFAECINFLIQEEKIDIKVLVKRHGGQGIAHEKNAIFYDNSDNKVVFIGSANASEQAYLFNKEDNTAFCSFWDEWSSTKTIKDTIESFDRTFNNGDRDWKILELDSIELKEKLKKIGFASPNKDKLYKKVLDYSDQNYSIFSSNIQEEIRKEIKLLRSQKNMDLKDLLSKYTKRNSFNFHIENLRFYQKRAVVEWRRNKCMGIMAMATGTGKTFTALGAISCYLKQYPKTIIIICCPYKHLIEQWGIEIQSFGGNPILIYSGVRWKEKILRELRHFNDNNQELFIVASNKSLLPESEFSKIIGKYWKDSLFVADEAHNLGSGNLKKVLPIETKARIGLSATIDRYFDETGTKALLDFFKGVIYEFSLENAIGKYLTPYRYFTYPVPLLDEEFEDYINLSEKIGKIAVREDAKSEEILKTLFNKRARIANNSLSKLDWLRENLSDHENVEHTLFYVGDELFQQTIDLLSFEKGILAQGFYADTHARMDVLKEFDDKIIKCLVAMKCLDEGVNVPSTKIAYFLASSGNPKEFVQRRGRILRLSKETGKTEAEIHDLVSVPPNYITRESEYYSVARSALKSQFKRIREFSSLAINKYSSLDNLAEIIDRFNIRSEI